MSTQVQIRGATQATQEARTLAARELDIDTTNSRLSVHDGSTAGGIKHCTFKDQQNQTFNYASATGTNTLTATFSPAPTSYAAGQLFTFKAENTNTGATTFNANSLGAKNIYKKDVGSGTIIALSSGDLIQNGIYAIRYDGTQFQLESTDGGGLQNVSQGDLNTSSGTFSQALIGNATVTIAGVAGGEFSIAPLTTGTVTMPGGQYGFCIESQRPAGLANSRSGWILANDTTSYVQKAIPFIYAASAPSATALGRQRYVTSSPPFDMGDGEVGGFMFAKLDKNSNVLSTYIADVPPWGYNGKTDIMACKKCPITGQKYAKHMKKLTIEQIMDGQAPEMEYVPITHAVKNADMADIPTPFGRDKTGETTVLLDPMDERVANLIMYQNQGGDLKEFLSKVKIDNESLRRKGPQGIMQVRFSI